MKPIKTLALGVSAVAISFGAFGTTTQAFAAAEGHSEYVENVDIDFSGPTAVITVKNVSANKHVNALDLKTQESKLDFLVDGFVKCKKANGVDFLGAEAYFGGVGIGGFGQLTTTGTLHSEKIDVAFTDKAHEIAEATEDTFSVPLNKIKNGHPALRIDPLEELEKARQAFNGSDVDFYKQDQEIVLQRPISLGTVCGKLNNTDKRSVGFETKNATVKVKYVGDAAVNDTPVLKAQLANNPNQIQQNPDLPFQLNGVDFQPNIPNYVGKCLPDQNPKIRVNFNVAGGKQGLVDLRIKSVSNQYADYGDYFEESGIAKSPNNGGGFLDFSFPLKEMLSQDKYSYMAISNNKTYSHNMKIEARYKNFEGGNWSQWKDYDTAVFKHRCTPVVVPTGGNGGKIGYDNSGSAPKLNGTIQAVPASPKPIDKIQVPVTATPLKIKRAQ